MVPDLQSCAKMVTRSGVNQMMGMTNLGAILNLISFLILLLFVWFELPVD